MRTGLLAEFETPELAAKAIHRLRELGYTRLDAFSPYPVDDIAEALELPRSPVPRFVLAAGLTGATLGYLVQWWTSAVSYPLLVGGFHPHSAPAFVPITFESAVLIGGLTAFFAVLALAGLPRLWHPLDEVDGFQSASIDGFWVAVDGTDPKYDAQALDRVLEPLAPTRVAPFGDIT